MSSPLSPRVLSSSPALSLHTMSSSLRTWLTRNNPALCKWLAPSHTSILPFVPRSVRWLLLLVLLVNVRGLPFSWTIRVFRPAIYARLRFRILGLFEGKEARRARLRALCPVGANPFAADVESTYTSWVSPDVADFNMHLSNSSYGMSYDMARFKYFVRYMPLFFSDGGWVALGATHYAFTREIPLGERYEVRVSMAAWDHKWVYMVARYITFPKSPPKKLEPPPATTTPAVTTNGSAHTHTLMTPDLDSATPSPARSPAPTPPAPLGVPVPPGALVHCTALSRLCFKLGRITIPPALALAASGFGMSPEQFDSVQNMRLHDGGKALRALYAGGWRDVPAAERWWNAALCTPEIERRRVEGLRGLAGSVGLPVPP